MEAVPRDLTHPYLTADEETAKRNTDCVYFLASPLTCKKGNECEFRHSEGARMNPRDCRYWLNGNCLNPKCSFRHPPLEGLLGTPGATAGSSLPLPQTTSSTQMTAGNTTQMTAGNTGTAYNSNKQSVPCIYFQKGLCLKGDRCPFMHGSQSIGNPTPQQQTPNPATTVVEPPQMLKKAPATLEKCTSQQKNPPVNLTKPVDVIPVAKPTAKVEIKAEIVPNNGVAVKKNMLPSPMYNELPRPKPSTAPVSGNAVSRPVSHQIQPLDEPLPNGREAGEFLAESSPGFDVLVDDEVEDADYYHAEDEYVRTAGNGRRHLNSMNEFDYDRSVEWDSLAKFDREPYNDFRDYDRLGRMHDRFGWEHRRASPEKLSERPPMMERRGWLREESPDQIDRSDLRHRLTKQRRVDGKSATSPDHRGGIYRRDDRHVEEQRYTGRSRRDQRNGPLETSISSRLQGRIMLPARSSPDNPNDLRSDREMDRGRHGGRTSPGRPMPYQGRHPDRFRRSQDGLPAEARNFRGQNIKRDENESLNFAGPKSLAELKGAKASESSEKHKTQLGGEQKNMTLGKVNQSESDGSLSFEGPKPLSEILKRKREAETGSIKGEAESGTYKVSSNGEDSNQSEGQDTIGSSAAAITEAATAEEMEPEKEDPHADHSCEVPRVTANGVETMEGEDLDDVPITAEGSELVLEGQTAAQKEEMPETEDGMMIDTMEDQEPETSDQRDGSYDYEANDGGEENPDLEDEYLDDDDGDDFSRRMGAMFS